MAWLAMIAGIGLQAAITALLGLSLTITDSLVIVAMAGALCGVLGAATSTRDRRRSTCSSSATGTLIGLNLWTAVSFIAFFVGVAAHGAGVVFTLEAAVAPLAVTAWSTRQARRRIDPQSSPGCVQWAAAVLLAVLGAALAVVLARADHGSSGSVAVATVCGVIAGGAAGAVVITSRSLSQRGVGVGQVMAHRFYATVGIAVAALLVLVPSGVLDPPTVPMSHAGAAALTTMVIPLFLLQYAMQRLPPVSVTAVLATMPVITLSIELHAGGPANWLVVVLGALVIPGSLALLVAQRRVRTRIPSPAAVPMTA